MTYEKQTWENLPSQTTPISAERLAHLETQYEEALSEVENQIGDAGSPIGAALAVAGAPTVTEPAEGNYWLSSALEHVTVDPNPGSRNPLWGGQEPSVWWDLDQWNMIYTNGLGRLAYRYTAGDPTDPANWSAEDVILDLGRTTPHSYLYREAGTLYLYFADHADQGIYVITAPASDPGGTWTAPVKVIQPTVPTGISGFHTGNMCVVKDGSTYYMFIEQLAQNNLVPDGTTNSWQMFVATGASPTGTFTDTVNTLGPLTTLRPNGMGSVSGPQVFRENGKWVMYYHGRAWARFFPDQGYRATTDDLAADAWVPLDSGRPFIRRAHAREYDQIADLHVAQHPDGHAYLFYAANKNFNPGWFYIMCTPLLPALMRRNESGEWSAASLRDNGELAVYNAYTPRVQQSVPYLDPQGAARGGTWALDTAPADMHGGVRRTNTSAAQNNWIAYDLMLAPGTYRLSLVHGKGPDHATINVALAVMSPSDFVKNLGNIEGYAAAPSVNNVSTLDFTVYGTEAAWARIRFMASAKQAASSGYIISDQGWTLTRTDLA